MKPSRYGRARALLVPLLAGLAALAGCAPPQPDLVRVGRAEVALPLGEWVELGTREGSLPPQIALPAGTPVQTRAMGLRGPNQEMLAVLLVQTNSTGVGWNRTLFEGACPDERGLLVEDRAGASPVRIDCLRFKRWADSDNWLATRHGAITRWLDERGVQVRRPYSHLSYRFTSEAGGYIAVNAIVDQRLLTPRTGNNMEFLRSGAPSREWSQQLAEAARLSVASLDGRFNVPPFPIALPVQRN